MTKCQWPKCEKEGIHVHDCSITGIGDFRHYCDEHSTAARTREDIWCMFRNLEYSFNAYGSSAPCNYGAMTKRHCKRLKELQELIIPLVDKATGYN